MSFSEITNCTLMGLSWVMVTIAPGSRVVVEGKQNLRPGGKIREATPAAASAPAKGAAPALKTPAPATAAPLPAAVK